MFAELNEIVLHVTDTIFLARVGVAELGAIAIADTILELFLVLPMGLVDGIQILTARQVGRKRPRGVGEIFDQGLALVVGIAVGLTAVLALVTPYLSSLLVRSGPVAVAVERYLAIGCYEVPFMAAAFAYSALLVSLGRTKALIPATVVLAVTNCVLDYILIFGKLGFPVLGIRGAAIGSLGAEIVTFLFLTGYVLATIDVKRFGLFRFATWNGKRMGLLLRISTPVCLQTLVEALRWFIFFVIVARMGDDALAAANVVYACYEVFRIPTEGFAETVCSLVSRLIGRGQPERIGTVLRHAIRSALLATLPFVVAGLLLPDWVLSVFTLDESLLARSMDSLRVVAIAMLAIIPAELWFTAVLGTGDTSAALGIEAVLTVVMLAATYLLAMLRPENLAIVWMSLPIAWLICFAFSYAWMKSGYWKRVAV